MSQRRSRRQREEEERMREIQRRRRIARERKRRQQIRRQKIMLAGIGVIVLIIAVAAAAVTIHRKNVEKKEQAAIEKKKQEEAAAKAEEENNTLHMVAVGDNLIHDAIIEAGQKKDWNFDFLYENIKKDIEEADLASVNQETPLVKEHEQAAGYPDFATPSEVGDALATAGFDIITQATEHAFDQEEEGIASSVSFWKDNYPEISLLGIHSKEGENRYQIIEKKNFKIAVMDYSCMLSENNTIPEDESYMVDTYSEKNIESDIKKAKEEADVTIVYVHGGTSGSTEPDEKLQKRVDFLAEQGADVVICSHPHIVKGYELKERPDGKNMLVYYSLGNFVSNQSSMENLLGGMADFTIKKDSETGEIHFEEYSVVPVVMHYNSDYSEAGIYKLSDYTEALAKEHGINEGSENESFTLAKLKAAAKEIGEIATGSAVQEGEDEDSVPKEDNSADGGSTTAGQDEE